MTASNWRGRYVRDSIQSRSISGGNFASLVGSNHCCRLVSSIRSGRHAAESVLLLSLSGAGTNCAASGLTRAGRATSTFLAAAFAGVIFIIFIAATQAPALIRNYAAVPCLLSD